MNREAHEGPTLNIYMVQYHDYMKLVNVIKSMQILETDALHLVNCNITEQDCPHTTHFISQHPRRQSTRRKDDIEPIQRNRIALSHEVLLIIYISTYQLH